MGIHTMGSRGSGEHFQPLSRHMSLFSFSLNEVESQLGGLDRPLGDMNIDDLLKSVCSAEAMTGMGIENASSAVPLHCQASLTLASAFSGKTVGEVWRAIEQGQKMINVEGIPKHDREPTLGETTLEDFLVKAGLYVADASLGSDMGLDHPEASLQDFVPQVGMSPSPSPSVDAIQDTSVFGHQRDVSTFDNTLDRRLKRKIKNRESAARSRARKQAYHNELVSKVSQLEEENMKLKKEKELDRILSQESSSGPKYQLRRTSSF